jgi:nucleolar protein 9
LKLLAGHEQELLHVIPVLLGFSTETGSGWNFIKASEVKNILSLVEENAYSHLMEVRSIFSDSSRSAFILLLVMF